MSASYLKENTAAVTNPAHQIRICQTVHSH